MASGKTVFYFRAKLSQRLPTAVRATLRAQCGVWPAERPLGRPWTSGDDEGQPWGRTGTLPSPAPAGVNWAGWHEHPDPFFLLPRASCIPRARDGATLGLPGPVLRELASGSLHLEFTCEFKNLHAEIQHFVRWLAPYVRGHFGRRRRGRARVWVGWLRPEDARRRSNIFVELRPGPDRASGPVITLDYDPSDEQY